MNLLLTFSAGAAEGQSGVHLVLYLDQGIKNHGTTTIRTRTNQSIKTKRSKRRRHICCVLLSIFGTLVAAVEY